MYHYDPDRIGIGTPDDWAELDAELWAGILDGLPADERPAPSDGMDVLAQFQAAMREGQRKAEQAALEQFNSELQDAVNAVDWSQPF